MSVWKSGDDAQSGSFPYSPSMCLPGEHPSLSFLVMSALLHLCMEFYLWWQKKLFIYNFIKITTKLNVSRNLYLDTTVKFPLPPRTICMVIQPRISRPLSHHAWILDHLSTYTDKLDLKIHEMLLTVISENPRNSCGFEERSINSKLHTSFQKVTKRKKLMLVSTPLCFQRSKIILQSFRIKESPFSTTC